MRTRLIAALTLATALLSLPAIVAAHAPLTSSSPKDGERLDSAPTKVTLTFGGELDPDGSSFKVTDAHGATIATGSVDLTVADRNVMTVDVSISDPGIYTVNYVSKSIDGAVLNGSYSFGYQTDATIPAATGGDDDHDAPDTAIEAPAGHGWLALIGLLFLGGGLALAARRVTRR
jgi:methionine-rich copper-binding protein CopC